MLKQIDVLVIGAGIAGSSCALQLARCGHRTVLLDRQAFPRHKTCGEFMSPETKEMLKFLGVDLLVEQIAPSTIDKAVIIMPHGGVIEAPLPGQAIGISRFTLDRLLHEQACISGAEIAAKATITGVKRLPNGYYEVEARHEGQLVRYEAKAVIGAYGARKPRGLASSGEGQDETVYVGVKSHYQGISIPSQVELYFCEGGYVGLSPIEDGLVNVAALLPLDMVQRAGKSVLDILSGASRENTRFGARLSEGTPVPGTQVSIAPIRLSEVPEPWSQFPHIGDAMLVIPPLCGDGMSIALRSSLLCSQWTDKYLRGEVSFNEWEQGYMAEAAQEFTQLLSRARWIQKIAFAKTNRLYPGLARVLPWLATYLVKATRLSEKGIKQ
ncbi:FAD-dependent oxidoreductase [Paenibacillus sp. J22TS3]|uniref:FAD-dependent oxidoreductase n=1 Tax=Paenibacillus sp. J22TS3 TaxID=2807192 RepID=UPI001BD06841|nr:FAD-dependent oxidoreductase [Paenibacillus sp. J22TS3]